MLVRRVSIVSQKVCEMEIPADPTKIEYYLGGRTPGLIQNVFPELNADQREFLLTGLTPEAWNELFGGEQ